MNLEEMNLEDVNKRLAELDEIVERSQKIDEVDSATEEKRGLLDRKAELEDLQERKQIAKDLTAGKIVAEVIEERNEEKHMDNEKMFDIASPEYRTAFFASLQGKSLSVEQRAAVTATAAIPTSTWNQIVEKMEMVAPIIGKITVSQMPNYLTIAAEDATADASWVAMGTASTDSADSLASVSLSAYKLIKTVEIGSDAHLMSIDAFESYIVNKLYKKMAKAVENAIVNGTGSGQPTGLALAGEITNTGEYTLAGMTYDDLLAIIGDLPDHGYRQNASFLMPSALFYSDVLPALTDKGSGLDVQAVEKQKVLNYDVVLCDRMPADTIIFGDLSYYHFNYASPVEVKADSSVGFRTGSTVYRAMALADGKPTNSSAFNKYTRSAI